MATKLYDAYGYPIQSRGPQLIDATRQNNDRPSWVTATDAIHKSVSYQDWRTMISASRRLWANYDVLKGATSQKAMHAIGRALEPEFRGADKAWGEKATAWLLNEWYAVCDVRGENFDFKTDLFLSSQCIDRDGNAAILLTESAEGYPQIQLIGIHRIGVRDSAGIVSSGPYKGLRIENGVIMNKAGRSVWFSMWIPQEEPSPESLKQGKQSHPSAFQPSPIAMVWLVPLPTGSRQEHRSFWQPHPPRLATSVQSLHGRIVMSFGRRWALNSRR